MQSTKLFEFMEAKYEVLFLCSYCSFVVGNHQIIDFCSTRICREPATIVPAGITPLTFENPEQLAEFLSYVSDTQKETSYVEWGFLGEKERIAGVSPSSTGSFLVTKSCSQKLALATFNTWADISVGYSGSYLHDTYSFVYNQSASSVSVKGGGIVSTYILIEGGVYYSSTPVSCSFTYRVY